MSRIYFHTVDDEAEVRGPERFAGSVLSNDLGIPVLMGQWSKDAHRILWEAMSPARPWSHYHDEKSLYYRLSMPDEETTIVLPDGSAVNVWQVILNTAIVLGSRPVCLLVTIHAQCEVHGWVDGPDRAWLADLIEEGRATGILRKDMGWESVIALLRKSAEGLVAMSYSVCAQFPNMRASTWEAPEGCDDPYEVWDELPRAERWAMSEAYIRQRTGLQLRPETLCKPRLGAGKTAFSVLEALSSKEVSDG